MSRRDPELRPGERKRADGSIVTNINVQLSPDAKEKIVDYAHAERRDLSDLLLESLYAAHPRLKPRGWKPRT